MSNLERAKALLFSKGYTCAVCGEGNAYFSTERGVKPLLSWVESGVNFQDYSAADKVVGKATAFLYLLLGVKEVYAGVISQAAFELLEARGVKVEYHTLAEYIINRRGDGTCPFETAVLSVEEEKEAYSVIQAKYKELSAQ